jgi:hypothetical protein
MNLTGARWSLTGAEAVLRLRALRSRNDFDAYWKFHKQQEFEPTTPITVCRRPSRPRSPLPGPLVAAR